jgi:hypothetical protein
VSLLAEGFRFVHRAGLGFTWMHPGAVEAGDLDCTDMSDEEFERTVRENDDPTAERQGPRPQAEPSRGPDKAALDSPERCEVGEAEEAGFRLVG